MISEDSDVLDDEDYDSCLYAMYLYDETALKLALRENDAVAGSRSDLPG